MTTLTIDSRITQTTLARSTTPTLVVFDSRVADLATLYAAMSPGAIGYTIDPATDGLVAITELLAQTGARRLAIVAWRVTA